MTRLSLVFWCRVLGGRVEQWYSVHRCSLCQVVLARIQAEHAVGGGRSEREVLASTKKVCKRHVLEGVKDLVDGAIHWPTFVYDCEQVVDGFGADMLDALSTDEDLAHFCKEELGCKKKELKDQKKFQGVAHPEL
mmetsp:Transcript_16804/g.37098  ORF Transcript_16804/g.37098 Transcript_16804/m.37098 type:complete len:135 (+) Transcript_16804:43-447(+)